MFEYVRLNVLKGFGAGNAELLSIATSVTRYFCDRQVNAHEFSTRDRYECRTSVRKAKNNPLARQTILLLARSSGRHKYESIR